MKIVKIEDLHCNAGWRDFSFLKITTDEGLIGWSEYNEGYGSAGLTAVIRRMAQDLIGHDPRPIERLMARQQAITRQAPGGLNQQAMAAIENALLDVKAKALGIPVYELFGGPVRDRLPLYWSHCGSYRFRNADVMGVEPVRSLDDLVKLGKHVKERGFKALKTNIFRFDLDPPNMHQPGFARGPGLSRAQRRRRHAGRPFRRIGGVPPGRRAPRWASCSTATSTSKPRATSRSRAPASPTICSGWRSIPTMQRVCA
jgi:L-alanine-DL-glutamate epimerase-like enolase superfamily enzyme